MLCSDSTCSRVSHLPYWRGLRATVLANAIDGIASKEQ